MWLCSKRGTLDSFSLRPAGGYVSPAAEMVHVHSSIYQYCPNLVYRCDGIIRGSNVFAAHFIGGTLVIQAIMIRAAPMAPQAEPSGENCLPRVCRRRKKRRSIGRQCRREGKPGMDHADVVKSLVIGRGSHRSGTTWYHSA